MKDSDNAPKSVPTWMVTYADLMALLLCLFVLLLSFAEVDSDSFKKNAGPISEAFNAVPSSLPSSLISNPIVTLIPLDTSTPEPPRRRITDHLEDVLASEIDKSMVEVIEEPNAVIIRFPGRAAFPSGNAELTDLFLPILDKISNALAATKGQVVVAGHTDNTPISTRTFRSNWDLSSARAVSVVHQILTKGEVMPDRIAVQGFADSRPLVDNDTPDNRSTNRRVEITVQMDEIEN
jgi:chemotaxis protein MotB